MRSASATTVGPSGKPIAVAVDPDVVGTAIHDVPVVQQNPLQYQNSNRVAGRIPSAGQPWACAPNCSPEPPPGNGRKNDELTFSVHESFLFTEEYSDDHDARRGCVSNCCVDVWRRGSCRSGGGHRDRAGRGRGVRDRLPGLVLRAVRG